MTKLALAVGKLSDFSKQQGLLFTAEAQGESIQIGIEDPQTHSSFHATLKMTHQLTFSGIRPAVDAWYVCMFEANRIMKFDPENPKSMEKFFDKVQNTIGAINVPKRLVSQYSMRTASGAGPVF